ncbi:MAG: hypothetical protein A3K65_02265 [Euryarchaeota archaeon RBG_16_68_12]|nr:MAG: hypothetical protein A3K65_02265 [Euryarchaeota archaeon RBG_16_68_12]
MIIWAAAIQLLTLMWIERKFYSRLQDRYGIMISIWSLPFWPFSWWARRKHKPTHRGLGYLQNIADGVKLIQKENITPALADSAMFHTAPVLIVSSTLMIFAALPFSDGFVLANMPLSLLFILAAFSIAPLGILIAGWSSNNKYSLIGGMRAAAQLMAYEIPLLLAVVAVLFYSGTLNVIGIVNSQAAPLATIGPISIPKWNIFSIPQFIGFTVFFVAIIAEMERIPFDIPEAEAELVEGWLTEYSGMRFGIVFGFKWLRVLAGSALVVILYLGGWLGPVWTLNANIGGAALAIPILPQEIWFLLKVYTVFLVIVWISWSVPRVRIDQILNIGWKRLIPLALLAILVAAFFAAFGSALGGIR